MSVAWRHEGISIGTHDPMEMLHLPSSLSSYLNPGRSMSAVHYLPVEILERIFRLVCICPEPRSLHTPSPAVRYGSTIHFSYTTYHISRVCCRWNSVCLAIPELWSWICIDIGYGAPSMLQLSKQLEAARGNPFHVIISREKCIDLSNGPMNELDNNIEDPLEPQRIAAFARILSKYAGQCQRIWIGTIQPYSFSILSSHFSGPKAYLTDFEVCFPTWKDSLVVYSQQDLQPERVAHPHRVMVNGNLIYQHPMRAWLPLRKDCDRVSKRNSPQFGIFLPSNRTHSLRPPQARGILAHLPITDSRSSTASKDSRPKLSFATLLDTLGQLENISHLTLSGLRFQSGSSSIMMPGSLWALFTKLQYLSLQDIEPQIISWLVVNKPCFKLISVSLKKCRLPAACVRIPIRAEELSLTELEEGEDTVTMAGFLSQCFVLRLYICRCPSFTSETLDGMSRMSTGSDRHTGLICPGLLTLSILGEAIENTISISALKSLIMGRKAALAHGDSESSRFDRFELGLDARSHFSNPSILQDVSLMGFDGSIGSEDLVWFQDQGYSVDMVCEADGLYSFIDEKKNDVILPMLRFLYERTCS